MTNDCASGKLRRLGLLVGAGALALGASHGVFAQNAPQRASQATGQTPEVVTSVIIPPSPWPRPATPPAATAPAAPTAPVPAPANSVTVEDEEDEEDAPATTRRTSARRPTMEENLASLRKQDERLIVIGERLAVSAANAGWCSDGRSLGWTLGDVGQYPKNIRQTVRAQFELPTGASLFVAAVAPGGVAARAGIVPGTGIVRINGRLPMRNSYDGAARFALANSERVIDEALDAGPIAIELLARDGTRSTVTLTGRAACRSRFEIVPDNEEQAYADGDIVQVTAGMSVYTEQKDEELAAVVAHELAHNMLRHIPRSEEAGTPNDYTRHLGRYARISRGMEEEADRLSVWLLAQAGYDPAAPVAFWGRFGPENDSAHPFGRLHDPWRTRVAAIQQELAAMRAAKTRNPRARPALLDRAVPPAPPAGAASAEADEDAPASAPAPATPRD